jgi:hypothetical protein
VRGRPRIAKRSEFGGDLGGLRRPDALEYLQCLPQEYLGLRGVAGGHGAAAQAGQRVSLVPRFAGLAGQVQGLLVTPVSLREVTADPVQRPSLVERRDLSTPVAQRRRPVPTTADNGSAKPLPIRLRREAARQDSKAGMHGYAAEAHKMKGISILVERLYWGYESGKRRAMRRSSTMAL